MMIVFSLTLGDQIRRILRVVCSDRAVTSIEYAMIGGFIAAVIAGVVMSLGSHLNVMYNSAKF